MVKGMKIKLTYQLDDSTEIKELKYNNVIGLNLECLENHLCDDLTVITFREGDEVKTATFYTDRIICMVMV